MLVDRTVRDLLSAFSSSDPTPGGGSASALASATGASLLMMVAGLPKTRTGSEADRSALNAALDTLIVIRAQLTDAIDTDTAAYDQVVAAFRLPKASADEQEARRASIQRAMRAATDVPLGVMKLSASALDAATVIAAHGHRAAGSDAGVGIALLRAGLHGARLNVDINVGSIADAVYVDEVKTSVARLMASADRAASEADGLLRGA